MKNLILTVFLLVGFSLTHAQQTFRAQDIINQMSKGQIVQITDARILGDLDFSQIEQKDKGGRYGIKGGIAQEYFSRITGEVTFTNCVFEGEIITKSELWDNKTKKENFSSFFAPISFEKCDFKDKVTFENTRLRKTLVIQDCIFRKNLVFRHVHFETDPIINSNSIEGSYVNEHTNWNQVKEKINTPTPPPTDLVEITLKNPGLKEVQIRFGQERWTLSPMGASSLKRKIGTQIYLLEKGSERLVMTLDKSMNGESFNILKF